MDNSTVSRARYEREKAARETAEKLLEAKSLELFEANQNLENQSRNLAKLVDQKTIEIQEKLAAESNALRIARQAKAELTKSEKKFRSFIENANDIVFTLNTEGVFTYLSPRLTDVLGYQESDLLGQHFSALIHPEDLPKCTDFFKRLFQTLKREAGLEHRVRQTDGSWRWHDTNASPLFDEDDNVAGMLGIGRDIQERKKDQERLHVLAHFDVLTGLANRGSILARLEQELAYAKSSKSSLAVMFLDLNKFKEINDTHGHEAGDKVLQIAAKRLKSTVREYTDAVGRLAGDEFLIILPNIKGKDTAEQVAKRVRRSLSLPVEVSEIQIILGCSVGVSMFPEDAHDLDTLVSHADTAMYQHKASKFGDAAFFYSTKP